MGTLATLYWPSLNPVGPPSIFAVLVVLVLWGGTSEFFGPRLAVRKVLIAGAPLLLLILLALTEGSVVFYDWHYGRSFPDAADYTAGIIYLAFGFGIALQNLRFSSVVQRFAGGFSVLVYSWLIVDTIRQLMYLGR
ncbi:MAG: hypothetical protein ACYTEL_14045 [Planctomycetota bacterium]|jgi:hypothetical protein